MEVKWWEKSIIAVELVAQLTAALISNGATFLVKLALMAIDLALLAKHTYDFYKLDCFSKNAVLSVTRTQCVEVILGVPVTYILVGIPVVWHV